MLEALTPNIRSTARLVLIPYDPAMGEAERARLNRKESGRLKDLRERLDELTTEGLFYTLAYDFQTSLSFAHVADYWRFAQGQFRMSELTKLDLQELAMARDCAIGRIKMSRTESKHRKEGWKEVGTKYMTSDVVGLLRSIRHSHQERRPLIVSLLNEALQEAGCENQSVFESLQPGRLKSLPRGLTVLLERLSNGGAA